VLGIGDSVKNFKDKFILTELPKYRDKSHINNFSNFLHITRRLSPTSAP